MVSIRPTHLPVLPPHTADRYALQDDVRQMLFTVALLADVLPALYELDPSAGRERLTELRRLAQRALAEMDTLMVGLSPADAQCAAPQEAHERNSPAETKDPRGTGRRSRGSA